MSLAALYLSVSLSLSLPPGLLSAICYVETAHTVSAHNRTDRGGGSLGVCQVQDATARREGFQGTAESLSRPEINISYAGVILARQLKRYRGDSIKAIAAYNTGTYLDDNGRPKNLLYVTKVLRAWKELR